MSLMGSDEYDRIDLYNLFIKWLGLGLRVLNPINLFHPFIKRVCQPFYDTILYNMFKQIHILISILVGLLICWLFKKRKNTLIQVCRL